MKKILLAFVSATLFLFAACEKENNSVINNGDGTITRTFSVAMPGSSKTHLDGMSIKWNAGDEINVIGITSEGTVTEHPFTLQSGANTSNAVFEGTVNVDETTFYAVYPNVAINKSKIVAATPLIETNAKLNAGSDTQTAVKDGFDPAFGFMTAKADGSGNLAFRHGMAYLKVKIGVDNVKNVNVWTSNARFYGKPSIKAADGNYDNVQSAQDNVNLAPSAGYLEKDAIYYIPVTCKNSSISTLKITYTFDDNSTAFVSTTKMSAQKLVLGELYDLGTPPIVKPAGPVLTLLKTTETGVAKDAAAGLTISSAYSIANGDDGDIVVTCDGTVVTAASVSGGTVTYTISENTGASPRNGWVGLQAGTGGEEKITITQVGVAALTPVTTTTTWSGTLWSALNTSFGGNSAQKSDFISDNLGFVNGASGSGFKFNADYVQLAGSGSAGTKCCIQFKVSGDGTVTVICRSGNNSNDRTLKVALGATEKGNISAPGASQNTDSVVISGASSGDFVNIYSGGSGINVYSITWTPAAP